MSVGDVFNVFRNEKNFSGVNCREKTTFRTSVRENPENAYFIIKIKGTKVCVKTAQKKLKNARFFVQSDKMKFFSIFRKKGVDFFKWMW